MKMLDGRWVVDDYYEDRALEEVTAKGLKPGDPVGELVDPRAPKELAELGAGDAGRGGAGGERGAGLGMYRAGGPTTLFGGAGVGPFSEGPLSAPKKAFFVREGVSELNFMLEAARRTRAANADWARGRAEALRPAGGVPDAERADAPLARGQDGNGVYEPHSGLVVCERRGVLWLSGALLTCLLRRPHRHAAHSRALGERTGRARGRRTCRRQITCARRDKSRARCVGRGMGRDADGAPNGGRAHNAVADARRHMRSVMVLARLPYQDRHRCLTVAAIIPTFWSKMRKVCRSPRQMYLRL
jgi:hypothetical protein